MNDLEADQLWLSGGCSLPKCAHCGGPMPDGYGPTHPPHPRAAGKFTCDDVEIDENDHRRIR